MQKGIITGLHISELQKATMSDDEIKQFTRMMAKSIDLENQRIMRGELPQFGSAMANDAAHISS